MPMPVLPAVPSTITPPGRSVPRFSASSMMARAARSFTEPPAGLGGIDATEKDPARFGASARRQHHALDGQQLAHLEPGFLDDLAADHLLGRLLVLDDSGDRLPGPGMVAGHIGAGAELTD